MIPAPAHARPWGFGLKIRLLTRTAVEPCPNASAGWCSTAIAVPIAMAAFGHVFISSPCMGQSVGVRELYNVAKRCVRFKREGFGGGALVCVRAIWAPCPI